MLDILRVRVSNLENTILPEYLGCDSESRERLAGLLRIILEDMMFGLRHGFQSERSVRERGFIPQRVDVQFLDVMAPVEEAVRR